ncbi:MAG TPA: homocysteine S-methyltransferase family protein [Planctomycetota bacterium]
MSRDVRRALAAGLVLADGAMGTELAARGLDAPFERFNLERPERVLDVHRAHLAAGARLLRSNTFLAPDARTALAGARLAREAAGEGILVAGALGPGTNAAAALAEGGCDLIVLETFLDPDELIRAIRDARATGLPVMAQMAREPELRAVATADVAGVNCVDADAAAGMVEKLVRDGGRPVSAFPHAGLPGRRVSPADFARSAARLAKAGARILGGCCGAGPEHVRALAKEVG